MKSYPTSMMKYKESLFINFVFAGSLSIFSLIIYYSFINHTVPSEQQLKLSPGCPSSPQSGLWTRINICTHHITIQQLSYTNKMLQVLLPSIIVPRDIISVVSRCLNYNQVQICTSITLGVRQCLEVFVINHLHTQVRYEILFLEVAHGGLWRLSKVRILGFLKFCRQYFFSKK